MNFGHKLTSQHTTGKNTMYEFFQFDWKAKFKTHYHNISYMSLSPAY